MHPRTYFQLTGLSLILSGLFSFNTVSAIEIKEIELTPPTILETSLATTQPSTKKTVSTKHIVTYKIQNQSNAIEINDTWDLIEKAKQSADNIATNLLIRAAIEFLDNDKFKNAENARQQINQSSLSANQLSQIQLIDARIAIAKGLYENTVEIIQNLDIRKLSNQRNKLLAQHLLAQSLDKLSKPTEELQYLLQIDGQLEDNEKIQNQKKMVGILQKMPPLEIALFREKNISSIVDGWIKLADILNNSNIDDRILALQNWRGIFKMHPIMLAVLEEYSGESHLARYKQIALVLPMTSKLGKAAKAFYDGFMYAHNKNFIVDKPKIILYDIGEKYFLVASYYKAAIDDGADFIVGPLGKESTESLLKKVQPQKNTLVIADIPIEKTAPNLYGISLAPEKQAQDSANHAFLQGYRSVSVLKSDDEWGDRVANAFMQRWQTLGGEVVKTESYSNNMDQSARTIQRLLGLDESIRRYKLLKTQLGIDLKFSSRRSDDMDFIFLASATNARLTVSQLRFFQAHDLPIYATSYVYDGYPNPNLDADLNGVVFGEIPWIVKGAKIYKERKELEKQILSKTEAELVNTEQSAVQQNLVEDTTKNIATDLPTNPLDIITNLTDRRQILSVTNDQQSQVTNSTHSESTNSRQSTTTIVSNDKINFRNIYSHSSLDSLYALGLQSYQLIPRLQSLRQSPSDQYAGEAITSSVKADGNIQHYPIWVQFKSGIIDVIPPIKNKS